MTHAEEVLKDNLERARYAIKAGSCELAVEYLASNISYLRGSKPTLMSREMELIRKALEELPTSWICESLTSTQRRFDRLTELGIDQGEEAILVISLYASIRQLANTAEELGLKTQVDLGAIEDRFHQFTTNHAALVARALPQIRRNNPIVGV